MMVEWDLTDIAAAVHSHTRESIQQMDLLPTIADTVVCRVRLARRTVIFKGANPNGADPCRTALEAWAYQRVGEAGVPAPRILVVDSSGTLFPAPYFLMEQIPGYSLRELGLPYTQQQFYLRQVGRYFRLIHSIPISGYGWLDEEYYLRTGEVRGSVAQWKMALLNDLVPALAYLEGHHLLDPPVVAALRDFVETHDHLLAPSTGACLLHGDLKPAHIYVDPAAGRVTGIIDFGNRWAGDPFWDFVPYRWEDRLDFDALLDDYEVDPSTRERLALQHLVYSIVKAIPAVVWCHLRRDYAALEGLKSRLQQLFPGPRSGLGWRPS